MPAKEEHYLGNPLLKKANIDVELTQEQLIELAKCSDDPIYFAKNYIKIVTLNDGLVNFKPYPFQETMLENFHTRRFNICKLPRQPLCLNTPIPTTKGWKTIGSLELDDFVYAPSGVPVRIIKKSQTFYNTICYKISFSSAESIISDEKHRWEIFVNGDKTLLETHELFQHFGDGKELFIESAVIPDSYVKNDYNQPKNNKHFITNIELTESVPVGCITVDSKEHLFVCGHNFIPTRNSGKSTTTVAFLIHSMLFEEHTSIAILANKAQTAKEILSRLITAYENLPKWMQQGVKSCNKTSMELENGSKVIAASTSASAVRGGTYSLLMLDEFAFVPEQLANNFMRSVYPTISSGDNSKVIVVSCVTKDTYILTPEGYRRIERLIDVNKQGAYFTNHYNVMGRDKFYSSSIVVNNGKSPTNIITTRYDSIECSEEHKLWAARNGETDYFKSKDLRIGDYVSLKFNTQIFGNNDQYDSLSAFKYGSAIREFLLNSSFVLSDELLSSKRESILAFLNGIFNVEDILYTDNTSKEFETVSKELARQLQLLLLNVGIFCRLEVVNNFYKLTIETLDNLKISDGLIWLKIENIEKSENEVYDVSLPDIEGDRWCHSVLYNNFLGHQTPQGMNHFYKLWIDAKNKENNYHPFEIHWSDVPGRDEKWKQEQIANTSEKDFNQEFNTEFLGSSETLIAGSKLSGVVTLHPIRKSNSLDVYEDPKKNHVYVTLVDTARGVEKDYHAFVIVDISSPPYKIVAKYRNNEIKPEVYSSVVNNVAKSYNESFLLCEVNDIGNQVARDLVDDAYPNMLMCSTKSRSGQQLGQNLSGKSEFGVKMQKNIKKIGCLKLKTLIEENILIINDSDIFSELTTFIQKGPTFEAEPGRNDDLVMCLVLFAWMTTQNYFKNIIDIDLRQRLLDEKKASEDEDDLPFGYSSASADEIVDDGDGVIWEIVGNDDMRSLLSIFDNYY